MHHLLIFLQRFLEKMGGFVQKTKNSTNQHDSVNEEIELIFNGTKRIVVFVLYITIFTGLVSCKGSGNRNQSPGGTPKESGPGENTPASPVISKADLAITNVEITPIVVKNGHPSSFTVFAANNGNIASSDFDVRINVQPAGNPNVFIGCCQPVHKSGIGPGETQSVYSGQVGANDPGSYELVILLKLADGTEVKKLWPFSASTN